MKRHFSPDYLDGYFPNLPTLYSGNLFNVLE